MPLHFGNRCLVISGHMNIKGFRDRVVGTFGDTNVERKRCTYDVNLTLLVLVQSVLSNHDNIRTAFTFYIRVNKGPYTENADALNLADLP